MKINSSSGKAELSPLKDRQKLNNSSGVKSEASMVSDTPQLKDKELLSRSIETVLKLLKPQDKNHEILKGLIQLIPRIPIALDGLPENTEDTRLLLRLLQQFRSLKGQSLPSSINQEQKCIEKILEKSLLRDGEQMIVLPEDGRFGRTVLYIKEKEQDGGEENESHHLELNLNLEHLGSVCVSLNRRGEKQSCRILVNTIEARNTIRQAHSELLSRIKEKGLKLHELTTQSGAVSNPMKGEKGQEGKDQMGLDLWG